MNFIVNTLCVIVAIASLSSAVELTCKHNMNSWTGRGRIQECLVDYLQVSSPDEVVTKLYKHDYTTIKSFFIHQSEKCLYMPKGVEKFLKHLEVLVIAGTGLKQIQSTDLKPFVFLKEVYLNDNQLEVLKGDLFEFNPEITILNFENNKIKQIGCGFLEPLIRLEAVKFAGNPFFPENALTISRIVDLKLKLKSQTCVPEALTLGDVPQAAALVSNCSSVNQPSAEPVNCELSRSYLDLKMKITQLEIKLNKTTDDLDKTAELLRQVVEQHKDTKMKLSETSTKLIKTEIDLTSSTKEFCVRYNDWTNEKCKGIGTTSTTMHPDDMTEGYIEEITD